MVASLIVPTTGTVILLVASTILRWVGTMIIAEPERQSWFRGRGPIRRFTRRRLVESAPA
jgi:hypothetical protein